MSVKNGVWHNATLDLPEDGKLVLCIKQNKKGFRDICFGRHYSPDDTYPDGHWVTSGSCSNVIYWMPAPEIPED